MLVTDVLKVDRTGKLYRRDTSIILSKGEPELKVAAFSALQLQVIISVVEIINIIEMILRIHLVHLIDEFFPEVLFT